MHRLAALLAAALLLAACAPEPLALSASAPFVYPASVDPSLQRVAIVVTLTNRSEDDFTVNPADLHARDRDHRLYPANVAATGADAALVRLAGGQIGLSGLLPLPSTTLRKNDVLSGFVVFDVPAGVRPVQVVYRDSDADHVVDLPGGR